MRVLEVDLNKLSDEGILRFLKLKQEIQYIEDAEIKEQNKTWMKKHEQDLPELPIPPPPTINEEEYGDIEDDYGDDE